MGASGGSRTASTPRSPRGRGRPAGPKGRPRCRSPGPPDPTTVSPTHPLLPKLKQLGLWGILQTWDVRAAQAASGHLTTAEFPALLLDAELERRQQSRVQLRLPEAGWEDGKTPARFDFAALPGLNRSGVLELATRGFLARRENLSVCGPTGVGKSRLMGGLACEAAKRG
jgi:DNA replication protein DnaC